MGRNSTNVTIFSRDVEVTRQIIVDQCEYFLQNRGLERTIVYFISDSRLS